MAKPIAAGSVVDFGQPPFRYVVHHYELQNMPTLEYRGHTISRVKYTNLADNVDYAGFECRHVYTVVDDLTGEPALPIVNQLHWTPFDAMHAVDSTLHVQAHIKNRRKWPTSIAHEVNTAIGYRRSFGPVYVALLEIEEMCRDAKTFDENPTNKILKRLGLLRQAVQEGAK